MTHSGEKLTAYVCESSCFTAVTCAKLMIGFVFNSILSMLLQFGELSSSHGLSIFSISTPKSCPRTDETEQHLGLGT